MFKSFAWVLGLAMLFQGCVSIPKSSVSLHDSADYYNYLQPDFDTYVEVSRNWLRANRQFISDDIERELNMNAPFVLRPSAPSNKAALLVHGLGDSPFYFYDIARSLQERGFHVHVLLVPGHGSKPADLMLPKYEDWQTIVNHYVKVLNQTYEELWLGGFSTGANLVTINAIETQQADGLLLFSPGFETHSPFIEKLAPIAATFMDWGWKAEENNIARYRSSPIQASISYSQSAIKVRALLEETTVTVPTFLVISEEDSVINPYAIKEYFSQHFDHADSRMIWYGDAIASEANIIVESMDLPDQKIQSGSHMSPLFSPGNFFYGAEGEQRLCGNSLSASKMQQCEEGAPVSYAAWGYYEKGKIFARLTWNPYYQSMLNTIERVLRLPM